jgi:hypothetical protein
MSHERQLQTFITELLLPICTVRATEATVEQDCVRLQLTATRPIACCPHCAVPSSSIQGICSGGSRLSGALLPHGHKGLRASTLHLSPNVLTTVTRAQGQMSACCRAQEATLCAHAHKGLRAKVACHLHEIFQDGDKGI